ncbi:unnamed protein product [Dibothriocephalus latus]|uniref:EF-hand domain-containing protein n=1 Tax=Dibothriocephalus latus TaxID=60516 RepID=A0A3P7PX61_DIBLA|nr:unnamed protein product [Dibothriocephalus latus]
MIVVAQKQNRKVTTPCRISVSTLIQLNSTQLLAHFGSTEILPTRYRQLTGPTSGDIEVNESFRLLHGQALTALPELTIVCGPKSLNRELAWYSLSFYVQDPSEPHKYTAVVKSFARIFHKDFKPFLLRADQDNDMKLSRPEFTQALEVGLDEFHSSPVC